MANPEHEPLEPSQPEDAEVQPEPEETDPDPTMEQLMGQGEEDPSEPAPDPEPEPEPDTPAPNPEDEDEQYSEKVQKRISKAVAKQRQAERDAEYWRKQAEKQQQPQPTEQRATTGERPPQQDDFETYEEYITARAEYAATQRVKQEWDQREKISKARQQQERIDAKMTEGERRLAEQGVKDFKDIAFRNPDDGGPVVTTEMVNVCMESDLTAELAYYFGKNPDVADDISRMTPIGVARAIGKIEAGLENGSIKLVAPTTTNAPPPIAPRVGAKHAGGYVDPDKLSTKEWMKREREGTLDYRR